MNTRIHIQAAKGGQGCSTTTALLALAIAGRGHDVLLVDVDHQGDLHRIFNTGLTDDDVDVTDKITITSQLHPIVKRRYEYVLYDTGNIIANDPDELELGRADHVVWVMRNCYLAIARTLRVWNSTDSIAMHHALLIEETHRALREVDVLSAFGLKGGEYLHVIHGDPVIARAVDAGLMCLRAPIVATLDTLTDELTKETTCT